MRRAAYVLIISLAVGSGALTAGMVAMVIPGSSPLAVTGTSDINLAFQPHPGARLPMATRLADESGRAVTLGDYFTKSPVILVLDYLRCTSLCGVTLRNLVLDGLNRLPLEGGRDYQLVTISIDPRDKPVDAAEAHAKYVALLDGRSSGMGMHFLTGAPAAAKGIAETVGFPYRYDSLLDAYIHPAGFVVAAPNGMISRYIEGVAISPNGLVDALAAAEQDTSQGPLTRLLLLCHVQGAPLGRFTVPVLTAFTIADIGAALALVAIFAAIRRHRYG
jgi:protein SCO1/2